MKNICKCKALRLHTFNGNYFFFFTKTDKRMQTYASPFNAYIKKNGDGNKICTRFWLYTLNREHKGDVNGALMHSPAMTESHVMAPGAVRRKQHFIQVFRF